MPSLNRRTLAKLQPPAKKFTIYWDDEVKGFGLRITANDARSFIFNYRTARQRMRQITIGTPSEFTVIAARDIARRYKQMVREGKDPLADRQGERDAPTVADLCQLYLDTHAKSKRPAPAKTDKQAIEKEILPALEHIKVVEVKYADMAKIHRKVTERAPYRANRILALLSTMFELAIKQGWHSDNPTKGVKRNHEEKRERYLSSDELNRLTEALANYPDQSAANAIRLLLMTGARRGEVLSAKWEQFDFERGTWTKPSAHTKQKRTHTVPLSPPALELLTAMRAAGEGSPYVFPGRSDGAHGHRTDLKKPWAAITKAAGISGLRVHDLRHSYASMLASHGTSLLVIGKLLGHTQTATTARYAHLEVDPLREATSHVGARIQNAGKPGAEITKLRNR
jgi:integrase